MKKSIGELNTTNESDAMTRAKPITMMSIPVSKDPRMPFFRGVMVVDMCGPRELPADWVIRLDTIVCTITAKNAMKAMTESNNSMSDINPFFMIYLYTPKYIILSMRLQYVNVLLFAFLILFSPLAYGEPYGAYNVTCKNSTHVQLVAEGGLTYTQGCAYGCYLDDCVDGVELSLNAFVVLFIYTFTSIMLFGLANKLKEDFEFTSLILYASGGLVFFFGVFGALFTYPVADDISLSSVINSVVIGLGQSFPWTIVFFIVLAVVIYILRAIDNFRKQAVGE